MELKQRSMCPVPTNKCGEIKENWKLYKNNPKVENNNIKESEKREMSNEKWVRW